MQQAEADARQLSRLFRRQPSHTHTHMHSHMHFTHICRHFTHTHTQAVFFFVKHELPFCLSFVLVTTTKYSSLLLLLFFFCCFFNYCKQVSLPATPFRWLACLALSTALSLPLSLSFFLSLFTLSSLISKFLFIVFVYVLFCN